MATDRPKRVRKVRPGFTLAEATLAMVLLGVAAAGVLVPFSGGASVQAEGLHRTLGALLANDLIERIVATPFDEIVATYGDHVETQGQIEDASGTPYTDSMYAKFGREASCKYVLTSEQSGDVAANFILATVRVTYQERNVATIQRLVSE